MTTTLPMLSGEGWLKDPKTIMSRLFTHMFLTDHSQSNVYAGEVTSLQYLLAMHGKDPERLSEAVERSVKAYYGRYFDNVQVEFTYSESDSTASEMAFDLYIIGVKDNVTYDLNRTLKADTSPGTSRFKSVIDGKEITYGE